ncbi:MAG: NusG domain II-containing protein [bacterium]
MLTLADKILIGTVLIAAGLSTWWVFESSRGEIVEIQTPTEVKRVSLSKQQTIFAHGALGTTTIEIKEKKVRVINSPCLQKLCVKMGWKDKNGQIIACIPNKIVVKIISTTRKQKVDAM